jgi:autotransporter-associated beta strand protein
LQLNNTLSLSSSSKNGLLFDGTGNYTINGNSALSAIGVYQYSTGTVTVNSAWGTSTRIDKFGPGLFVNNTPTAFSSSGGLGLNLWEGVYRAGTANAVSGGGRINIGGGGILELTSGSGDLTRFLGTRGTNLAFLGDGGFSAFGGNRTVALGGTATPTNLVWNNTGSFLSNGNKLILSSTTSDSTITLANAIDLNGVRREIAVNNGSASVDAVLSGNVSSNAYSGGSLYKSGTGTLAVTGNNTYNGGTTIANGTLLANSASSTGSGSVSVLSGATLGGNGVIAGGVSVSGTLSPGESAGLLTVGALTLNDGSTTLIELDGTARGVAGGYDAVNVNGSIAYDGTLSIVASAAAAEGEYDLFNFTNVPSTSFDSVLVSGAYGSGSLSMTSTGFAGTIGSMVFTFTGADGVLSLSAEAVPEPLTAAGVLLLSVRLFGRRERMAM